MSDIKNWDFCELIMLEGDILNDKNFKITLIRALEHEVNRIDKLGGLSNKNKELMMKVVLSLPVCNVYLEETSIFTRREWNTYCTILHIQVPISKLDLFESQKSTIQSIAEKIYGRQGDNLLTHTEIGILVEKFEVIDLSSISIAKVIEQSISDAELFMKEAKYDSAFDRVHTAFHGYLRKLLETMNVPYEESETLGQLYNKLHTELSSRISPVPVSDLIKTIMRSASGVISSINDIRNKHSLAHPNEQLVSEREALLAIKLIRDLSDYINSVLK